MKYIIQFIQKCCPKDIKFLTSRTGTKLLSSQLNEITQKSFITTNSLVIIIW